MYNDFGSKYVVKTLNANGFCTLYSAVQRHLTSTVNHNSEWISLTSPQSVWVSLES